MEGWRREGGWTRADANVVIEAEAEAEAEADTCRGRKGGREDGQWQRHR